MRRSLELLGAAEGTKDDLATSRECKCRRRRGVKVRRRGISQERVGKVDSTYVE